MHLRHTAYGKKPPITRLSDRPGQSTEASSTGVVSAPQESQDPNTAVALEVRLSRYLSWGLRYSAVLRNRLWRNGMGVPDGSAALAKRPGEGDSVMIDREPSWRALLRSLARPPDTSLLGPGGGQNPVSAPGAWPAPSGFA